MIQLTNIRLKDFSYTCRVQFIANFEFKRSSSVTFQWHLQKQSKISKHDFNEDNSSQINQREIIAELTHNLGEESFIKRKNFLATAWRSTIFQNLFLKSWESDFCWSLCQKVWCFSITSVSFVENIEKRRARKFLRLNSLLIALKPEEYYWCQGPHFFKHLNFRAFTSYYKF